MFTGRGCADCSQTGYRGRTGIYEIFAVDEEVRRLVYEKVPSNVMRARAREIGHANAARGWYPQDHGGRHHAGGSHFDHAG